MPTTFLAVALISNANLNAIGQNGLVGTKSIFTTPDSCSLTLWIRLICPNVKPVSGSMIFSTSFLTLVSNSFKAYHYSLNLRLGRRGFNNIAILMHAPAQSHGFRMRCFGFIQASHRCIVRRVFHQIGIRVCFFGDLL